MKPYTDATCNRKWYIATESRGEGRAPEGLRSASGKLLEFNSEQECQEYIDGLNGPPGIEIVEIGEITNGAEFEDLPELTDENAAEVKTSKPRKRRAA